MPEIPAVFEMLIISEKLNLFLRCIVVGTFILLSAAFFLVCTQKKMKKSGYIRFLYVFMLLSSAGAGILFLMGMVVFFLPDHIFLNRWTFWLAGWKVASGNMNFPFVYLSGMIWISGIVWYFSECRKRRKVLKTLYLLNRPVSDEQVRNCFFYAAEKAGIRKIPLLFTNEAVGMPFIKGIINPVVIIPAGLTSYRQLTLTFAHELAHWKRRDLIFRCFQRCVLTVYWFLPVRSFWRESFVELQETLCDIDVCRSYGNHFSAEMYYVTILSMLQQKAESAGKYEKTGEPNQSVTGLLEHAGQLERRVGNMVGYRSGSRRKGLEAALIAAGSILFLVNVFAGIYWPDILSGQSGETRHIVLDVETEELRFDAGSGQYEAGYGRQDSVNMTENNDLKTGQKELKWEQKTVYHLAPGETIGSENFRGKKGETLILMTLASEGGYEIRLTSGTIPVFASVMDDTECLNLKLQNRDYRLQIRNPGDYDIKIELYCAK